MEMMSGMAANLIPKGQEAEATKRLKGFLCIMDSMTSKELDDATLFQREPSRIERVAYGSGHHPQVIGQLLAQYMQFEKMIGKMADMQKKMAKSHGRANPQQQAGLLNNLAGMLPPGMMDQMGGAQGLQDMIKQMGGMEGLMGMAGGAGGLGGLGGLLGGGRGARKR
eukprot:TRINITY_DN2547_c0_g1_i2.p1 TRINITY_DN2547_c0_g1~~TRINITY_DN2547_c0_g1_i2.p1  ORF type:complete len:167 (-),score=66.43 TRINITY_DN2547_c0_g1_i2:40-540(-)